MDVPNLIRDVRRSRQIQQQGSVGSEAFIWVSTSLLFFIRYVEIYLEYSLYMTTKYLYPRIDEGNVFTSLCILCALYLCGIFVVFFKILCLFVFVKSHAMQFMFLGIDVFCILCFVCLSVCLIFSAHACPSVRCSVRMIRLECNCVIFVGFNCIR